MRPPEGKPKQPGGANPGTFPAAQGRGFLRTISAENRCTRKMRFPGFLWLSRLSEPSGEFRRSHEKAKTHFMRVPVFDAE